MSAYFIISFDCEGKWGVADHLTDHHRQYFTNQNLINTYTRILNLLEKYEIPATFAFVGAFTLSVEEYYCHQDRFRAPSVNGIDWLVNFKKEVNAKNFDGWFVPKCLELVEQHYIHEIASHGFTHLPLDEKSITQNAFLNEMALIKDLTRYGKNSDLTLVYPRNQIGYVDELKNFGFIGYRNDLDHKQNTPFNALRRLSREFNIFSPKSDPHIQQTELPIRIPSGHFLNWRYGVRKKIPPQITVTRWKNMLEHAIKNNDVVHLWSHPHNFIDGKDMFSLFENILKNVAYEIKNQRLKAVTQRNYCQLFKKNALY